VRRNIFRHYFSALIEGDPVALGITAFFLVVIVGVLLLAWKFKRQHQREDEEKRRRWGIKDPKKK
jgi:hypothetical protein